VVSIWKVKMKRGKGGKLNDKLLMNSGGEQSLMNPKTYIGLTKPM